MGFRVACVVKEAIPEHIAEFAPKYWHGDIFLDADMSFYKHLGAGELVVKTAEDIGTEEVQTNFARASEYLTSSVEGGWEVGTMEAPGDWNFDGEGFITGGIYVIAQGGAIALQHSESQLGSTLPVAQVMEVAAELATSSVDPPVSDPVPAPAPITPAAAATTTTTTTTTTANGVTTTTTTTTTTAV
eukprot:SAG31_NODE_1085_length_10006_cov_34.511154_5_plen_187_part_00